MLRLLPTYVWSEVRDKKKPEMPRFAGPDPSFPPPGSVPRNKGGQGESGVSKAIGAPTTPQPHTILIYLPTFEHHHHHHHHHHHEKDHDEHADEMMQDEEDTVIY